MSTYTLSATTTIHAPTHHIQSILTDFPSYPLWSRYITALEPISNPSAPPGTKLLVTLRKRTLHEKVILNDATGFGWGGQIITPGIFAAENRILIEKTGEGETKLVVRGEFRGVLFAVMKMVGAEREFNEGVSEFLAALKERCESTNPKV